VQSARRVREHRQAVELARLVSSVFVRFEYALLIPKSLRSTLDGGRFVSFLHRESLGFQGLEKAAENTRGGLHKRKRR
jgi:hypothetical protein